MIAPIHADRLIAEGTPVTLKPAIQLNIDEPATLLAILISRSGDNLTLECPTMGGQRFKTDLIAWTVVKEHEDGEDGPAPTWSPYGPPKA